MATCTFTWDETHCEKLAHRCTQIMLGLMGLALMLMMMDMASIFLLAPAGVAVLVTRNAQRHYEKLLETFEDAEVELAPRTLQFKQSASGEELRIRYRDINSIENFKRWGISAIRLNVNEREPVELYGFSAELETRLTASLKAENSQA